MSNTKGILYGVGVGPGDPDLLTLKAVSTLARADRIFASSSSRNGFSLAESIIRPHLTAETEVHRLRFPMTKDRKELEDSWNNNAQEVLAVLNSGQSVALVTLGDPLLYSTFGYVLQTVRRMRPDVPVEIVPGITSFQHAAARTQTILAEAGESLQILPATMPDDQLATRLQQAENTVLLKAYKNLPKLRALLEERGLSPKSLFVSRLGLDGELICRDIAEAPECPNYLSLLLIKHGMVLTDET